MTRYTKTASGQYVIHGKKFEALEGSRAQVWHGTAYKTSGELKKHDLFMNKHGRIVSKKKHATAKREKRLVKAGYTAKKGKFGFVRIGKSKKQRGGYSSPYGTLDAAPFGEGVSPSGVATADYEMNASYPSASYTGGKKKRGTRKSRKH